MKRALRDALVVLIVAGVVLAAMGCRKASPDDAETMALAKQFMEAVYVSHDSALAMSLVVPIDTYGYVTTKIVEDTVATEIKNKCITPLESVQPGALSGDVTIPDISATDTSKGITARTAWLVSSKYRCGTQARDADRLSIVYLEKVNGKWGISKVSWQSGLGPTNP